MTAQSDRIADLRKVNKDQAGQIATLTKELDTIANRARMETERNFWRASYEELLDKLVKTIYDR